MEFLFQFYVPLLHRHLKHISLLGWEHIILLGECHFDVKNVLESDELRPLNINNP